MTLQHNIVRWSFAFALAGGLHTIGWHYFAGALWQQPHSAPSVASGRRRRIVELPVRGAPVAPRAAEVSQPVGQANVVPAKALRPTVLQRRRAPDASSVGGNSALAAPAPKLTEGSGPAGALSASDSLIVSHAPNAGLAAVSREGEGHGEGLEGGSEDAAVELPVGAISVLPRRLGECTAAYPAQARRLRIEGQVKLKLLVSRDGEVADVEVLSGLGYGLDEAAVSAIKQCRFAPALWHEQPVATRITYLFTFVLDF